MGKEPTPVLKEGVIYLGDNGQAICVHCAGSSAKFSGHDISGQKVMPCTQADVEDYKQLREEHPELKEFLKEEYACECGKTKYEY